MPAAFHRAVAAALFLGLATPVARVATAQMVSAVSAPVSDIRYDVTADSAAAANRRLLVVTTVTMAGPGPLVLELPAWTPGAYELTWFSRWVSGFSPATPDGKPLVWDKVDFETWRIETGGAKTVQIAFTYEADSLDNATSWTRPDFVLFNGTNLFLYPAGRGLNFPATVTVHTSPSWLVTTGMAAGAAPGSFTAPTYHDLVDMYLAIDVQRLLTWRAAATAERGVFPRVLEATLSKLNGSQMAPQVSLTAVKLHGGDGVTREFPVQTTLRDAVTANLTAALASVSARLTRESCSLASAVSSVGNAFAARDLNTACAASYRVPGSPASSVRPPSAASIAPRSRLLTRTLSRSAGASPAIAPPVAAFVSLPDSSLI